MRCIRNLSRKVIARGVSVKSILQNETSDEYGFEVDYNPGDW